MNYKDLAFAIFQKEYLEIMMLDKEYSYNKDMFYILFSAWLSDNNIKEINSENDAEYYAKRFLQSYLRNELMANQKEFESNLEHLFFRESYFRYFYNNSYFYKQIIYNLNPDIKRKLINEFTIKTNPIAKMYVTIASVICPIVWPALIGKQVYKHKRDLKLSEMVNASWFNQYLKMIEKSEIISNSTDHLYLLDYENKQFPTINFIYEFDYDTVKGIVDAGKEALNLGWSIFNKLSFNYMYLNPYKSIFSDNASNSKIIAEIYFLNDRVVSTLRGNVTTDTRILFYNQIENIYVHNDFIIFSTKVKGLFGEKETTYVEFSFPVFAIDEIDFIRLQTHLKSKYNLKITKL